MKNQSLLKKKMFVGAFLMLLAGVLFSSISTPAHAHRVANDPNHKRSAFEELVRKYGGAGAQGRIAKMKPSAQRRFWAKERAHPRKYQAIQALKARVRERTRNPPVSGPNPDAVRAMNTMIQITKNRNAGCINCHAVRPLNGTRSTPTEMQAVANDLRGSNINHPSEGYAGGCSGCHISGWHTPPRDLSFNGKSDNALCIMLDTPANGQSARVTVFNHLNSDSLINWAIRGQSHPTTRNPGNPSRSSQNRQTTWQTAVRDWVNNVDYSSGNTSADRCSTIR